MNAGRGIARIGSGRREAAGGEADLAHKARCCLTPSPLRRRATCSPRRSRSPFARAAEGLWAFARRRSAGRSSRPERARTRASRGRRCRRRRRPGRRAPRARGSGSRAAGAARAPRSNRPGRPARAPTRTHRPRASPRRWRGHRGSTPPPWSCVT